MKPQKSVFQRAESMKGLSCYPDSIQHQQLSEKPAHFCPSQIKYTDLVYQHCALKQAKKQSSYWGSCQPWNRSSILRKSLFAHKLIQLYVISQDTDLTQLLLTTARISVPKSTPFYVIHLSYSSPFSLLICRPQWKFWVTLQGHQCSLPIGYSIPLLQQTCISSLEFQINLVTVMNTWPFPQVFTSSFTIARISK